MMGDHNLVSMSEEWRVREKIRVNFIQIIYKILGDMEIVDMELYWLPL